MSSLLPAEFLVFETVHPTNTTLRSIQTSLITLHLRLRNVCEWTWLNQNDHSIGMSTTVT